MDEAYLKSLIEADPFDIPLNFTNPAGVQSVLFKELDHWLYRSCQGCIIMGVRLGASIILMIALYLLFKPKSRKTPLFFALQTVLFFMCLKTIFYMYYFLSASSTITFAFSGYYVLNNVNKNMTAVTDILQVLFIASIQAVFILQLKAMYSHTGNKFLKKFELVSLYIVIAMAVVTTAFYILSLVLALIQVYNERATFDFNWYLNVPIILFLSSVCFSSFCLVLKTFYCYWNRRRLGMKNFSTYQIMFIMSCQTMIIPVIVNIASYSVHSWTATAIPELVYFITVIFLPLSVLWAASNNETSDVPYSNAGYLITSSNNSNIDYSSSSMKSIDIEAAQEVVSTSSINFYPNEKGLIVYEDLDTPTTLTTPKKLNWTYANSNLGNEMKSKFCY